MRRASVEIRVDLALPAIPEGPRLIVHKIHHFAFLSNKEFIPFEVAYIAAYLAL